MHDHDQGTSGTRYIPCAVGDGTCCLPLSAVLAIRRIDDFEPNPDGHRPAGWVRVSGRRVPVLGLASLMGLPGSTDRGETFLVVGAEEEPWALGVDRIAKPFPSVARRPEAFPLVEGGAISPFFHGAALDGERLVPILALDRLRAAIDGRDPAPLSTSTLRRATDRAPRGALGRGGGVEGDGHLLVFSTAADDAASALVGLSLWSVTEVRRPATIWPLPGAVPCVLGIVEWHGGPLPVIDLGPRLGLDEGAATVPNRLIVVRSGGGTALAGLCARSDIRLRRMDAGARGRREADWPDPVLTRAVFELDGRPLVIPDLSLLIQDSDAFESRVHQSIRASAQKGALQ
jgi:chemotaxis signal transduction protein